MLISRRSPCSPVPYASSRRPFGYCGAFIVMLQSGSVALRPTSAAAPTAVTNLTSLADRTGTSKIPGKNQIADRADDAASLAGRGLLGDGVIAVCDQTAAHRGAERLRADEHGVSAVDPAGTGSIMEPEAERVRVRFLP